MVVIYGGNGKHEFKKYLKKKNLSELDIPLFLLGVGSVHLAALPAWYNHLNM